MNDGFGSIRSPLDLFRKLEHDRARMAADPLDTYAAFDFFVTADHMLDWIMPDHSGQSAANARTIRRKANHLLQVASHLGNGAKHFRVTKKHHTSVEHADVHEGGFDPRSFDPRAFSPGSFSMSGLHVELDDGSVEHAYTLADALLAYWRKELGI